MTTALCVCLYIYNIYVCVCLSVSDFVYSLKIICMNLERDIAHQRNTVSENKLVQIILRIILFIYLRNLSLTSIAASILGQKH